MIMNFKGKARKFQRRLLLRILQTLSGILKSGIIQVYGLMPCFAETGIR